MINIIVAVGICARNSIIFPLLGDLGRRTGSLRAVGDPDGDAYARCTHACVAEGWKRVHKITSRLRDDVSLRAVALPSTSIAARTRDRSALASREKCPCFQFARLLRSRPSGVRGPVLLPP